MGHISRWSMLMIQIYWEITHITKENTKALIDRSKELGVRVNAEKTMYILMSRQQNAG
jgi:hypothetical protein